MAKSPAGVHLHFSVSSVFSWGEERFQVTAWALHAAAFERLWGRRWGMYPEPEHPAQRWWLYGAFDSGGGGGGGPGWRWKGAG
jgi:hypothetical protein